MTKDEVFEDYVQKYATARQITVEEAYGHIMVKLYKAWLYGEQVAANESRVD